MPTTLVRKHTGFTLIEVVVFLVVFSVALITIVSTVTYSSVLIEDSKHKVIGTRFGEELLEWVKFQKDLLGYEAVRAKVPTLSNAATFCFNTLNLQTWPSVGACSGYNLKNFYKRELTLTKVSADELVATIVLSWRILDKVKTHTLIVYVNKL